MLKVKSITEGVYPGRFANLVRLLNPKYTGDIERLLREGFPTCIGGDALDELAPHPEGAWFHSQC